MIDNKNVFIEFEIIRNSNLQNLITELDILIAAKKCIYLWSKDFTPSYMKQFCKSTIIPVPQDEHILHKKIRQLKAKGKTYKEISEETGISVKSMSYYLKFTPDDKNLLSGWIIDYYKKDSAIYAKVDILVDNDSKIVNRFIRAGKEAHLVERI